MSHEHDYRKLNDEAVFCRGCGDIKHVDPPACALPHYPVWFVPNTFVPPPYVWWGTTTTGHVQVGSTTYDQSDASTYTVQS